MSSDKALPKGSTILVTGGAGYIGAAVSSELLKAGYKVRAATRSIAKSELLKKRFDTEFGEGHFNAVQVEDYATPGAYDEVMKDVAGVAHIAADVSMSKDTDQVIKHTVAGISSVLESCAKSPTIKRVVFTSSRIAAFYIFPDQANIVSADKSLYNDPAVKAAHEYPDDHQLKSIMVYAAAKTEGERAAWNWVKEHKPSFVFNTVLPDLVLGEIINPSTFGSTAGYINEVFLGKTSPISFGILATPSFYVDVKDTARLHVAALIEHDVQNERLWGNAGPFTVDKMLNIWREAFPDRTSIPKHIEGLDAPECTVKIDRSRELELLKRQGQSDWVSLKTSLLEQVKGLIN